jgi:hypothetical protein
MRVRGLPPWAVNRFVGRMPNSKDIAERKMNKVPTGTEVARPFLPTKDFDLSRRFYETLGFDKVLDGDVAIFNVGSGGFILQRRYQQDWAENCMMQLLGASRRLRDRSLRRALARRATAGRHGVKLAGPRFSR